ncbi:MAG: hypothetical protein HUK01_02285, partial [Bacteroidaceae bacterium]|nr:hypothetical protein [Bacteroidaceae bacterium]
MSDKAGKFDFSFTPFNAGDYYCFDDGTHKTTSSSRVTDQVDIVNLTHDVTFRYGYAPNDFQDLFFTRTVTVPAYMIPNEGDFTAVLSSPSTVELTWTVPAYDGEQYKDDQWVVERDDNKDFTHPSTVCQKPFSVGETQYSYTQDISDLNLNGTQYYRLRRTAVSNWGWADAVTRKAQVDIATEHRFVANPKATMYHYNTEVTITWDWTGSIWSKNSKLTIVRTNEMRGTIATINVPAEDIEKQRYIDKLPTTCDIYSYKMYVTPGSSSYAAQEEVAVAETNGKLYCASMGKILSLETSKGYYGDRTILKWTTDENPIESFAIMSREHGSEASFNQIGQLAASAGSTNYTFKDDMCVPGVIYDYQVLAITTCGGEAQSQKSATVLGFSGATGTVNGRITYGSGQAVKDVVVRAVPEESDMTQNMAYYSNGATTNAGILAYLEVKDGSLMKNATNSATIQVWAKIEDEGELVTKPGMFTLAANDYGKAVLTAGSDTLVGNRKVGWSWREDDDDTPLEYFQLTAVITPDSLLMYVNGEKDASIKRTAAIFGEDTKVQMNRLRGSVDEVRLWSKALDAKTIAYNYNTYLAGNEDGLEAYYTFNPCTDTEFWDRSRVGNEYRKRDGVVVKTRTKVIKFETTTDTPTLDQLSYNGITDEDGSYTLRDVPYYGNGTSYTFVPDLGIHKFDPTKEMRFLSKNTENFTVNFTDVSSFPVSGVVYYENTNYPVEGCNLYVDGTVCTKDGELIATDKDGHFEISVPIGDHFIEIRKSEMGHTFANAGRYPADPHGIGLRHTFDRAMTGLTFYESTLVNFSGRVTGGNVEGGKALGLGESVNTIGQVELVLQASNPDYSLNVTRTVGESGLVDVNKNTETLPVAAAQSGKSSYTFGSEAWRGAKVDEVDNTKNIYIRTDKETGEFSAMLPPLKYKLLEAKIVKTNESVISADQGLPEYDLTNPSMTVTDSLAYEDGTVLSYECHKKAMITHHTAPMFSVKDKNAQPGAFGIKEYTVSDQYGKATIDDIYTVDGNGKVTYRHDAPLFVMCDPYDFVLEGYEEYTNADNGTVSKEPLAGVVVTIANNLADNQPVYYEGDNAGQVADGQNTLVTLDENGQAVYRWKGGLPNISESPDPNVPDYSRTISMSYEVDGRTYQWDGNPLHGIVLGNLTTGTNFVTAGPDKVEMVLRDPPGTASHAEWTEGTTVTITNTIAGMWKLDESLSTTTQLGIKQEIAVGVGVATINKMEVDNDIKVGIHIEDEGENAKTSVSTITTERTISTSDGIDFVGSKGDVYIGRSTNVTFGKARQVGLTRESETAPIELTKKDVISTGLSFGTVFNYTQFYIETVLIPNLEALLEQTLITYDGDIESYTNNTDKPVYLTHWKPGDENYGKKNYDITEMALAQIFGKSTISGPNYWMIKPSNAKPDDCFQDEVNWLIEQIANWKQTIANNEKDKVMAYNNKDSYFDKNISFDSGAKVSYTWHNENTKGTKVENQFTTCITGGTEWGAAINGIGVKFELECENGGGVHTEESTDSIKSTQFVYELAEDGNNDALSVDVLKSPAGWSPIFHTVAGQTSAPYEGKEETKYYEPGQHVLNEATMQVEVPKIGVEVATLSDVPTGSAANFTLLLTNESESDADVFYKLLMLEHSNTNGATLKIDGEPLTDGRRFRIAAGETVKKLLQLSQSDYSVLDYENIGIVLASESQVDIIADTTYVTAHFVPSSSDVSLHIDRPLL